MKRVLAFVGPAGAGKDTVAKLIHEALPGSHMIVSCTTRPPRDYEVDGVDYHFISGEEFAEKVLANDMLEATCFNDWFYGTMASDLIDGWNIGVFNPEGWESLNQMKSPDLHVYGFYVSAKDKTRLLRQLNREENPDVHEIIRRFKADEEDFANLAELPPLYWLVNEDEDDLQDIVYEVTLWAQEHN